MTHPEYEYLKLIANILKDGRSKPTRGIHGIKSVFGAQLHFDMRQGFPLLTTKKMPFKILLHELFWFISGSSDVKYLHDHKIFYWDGFLHEGSNDLGRVYGVQWRHWKRPDGSEFDQLQWAIDELKNNPDSKAIIVSAWNTGELDEMRLPPCHTMFQFDLTKGKLRLHLYQRSWDVFLGAPFNIAQYALLLHMVAHIIGAEPRELVISAGNAHLYNNHLDAAKEQIQRKPLPLPKLKIVGDVKNIDDFKEENFLLEGYQSHPHIKTDLVIL
ncbi:MAG TPA: thymidylate synthase [Patescibacteria group bacterium]|jgi:thymidylate synthase|nr:thymidylate synthase [Patescibacteria group bacterium]